MKEYMFPVEERRVYYKGSPMETTNDYKAIVRKDTNELISIMRSTYQLVKNEEIIKPLIDQLSELDTSWKIDSSHSYVENRRMRLQVTFPELTFDDGRSDIALSLFLHNSYDGSEGIRMLWGAIRGICSNGMVFGKTLAKFYARHTKNVDITTLKDQLEMTYDQIPVIKERINILQNLSVSDTLKEEVEKKFGKKTAQYVQAQPHPENQWILYNILTYYISHIVKQHMCSAYQLQVSKLFQL